MFIKSLPGFKFYRNADGGAAGGAAAPAAGAQPAATAAPAGGAPTKVTGTMGDAAAASATSTSAAASVPASMGQQPKTSAPDFKTSLGDLAADQTLAKFNDVQSLAKSYKEAQALIGQKLGIPGDDATPEAKAAFHKAMGVPDAVEGYGFKKPEGLPANMPYDEKDAAEWAAFMKENNVPVKVANALRDRVMKMATDQWNATDKALKEDSSKTDEGFDAAVTRVFGDKKATAVQNSRVMLEKYVSKETAALMKDVPNEHLAAFAEFASNFSKEMTGEDMVLNGDAGGASTQSEGEIRQEMRRIMALPEFSNPFVKGKEAHEKSKQDVKELSTKIAKMQARAKK